jgi:hypothetical protein
MDWQIAHYRNYSVESIKHVNIHNTNVN